MVRNQLTVLIGDISWILSTSSSTQQSYYQKESLNITEVNGGINVQFNNQQGYLTYPAMWLWSNQSVDIPTLLLPECMKINNITSQIKPESNFQPPPPFHPHVKV